MIILVLFAFLGGIVTILSPCILPILPIVLSSSVDRGKFRPYGIVAGFIASFTFFTLFLTTIVKLTNIPAESLRFFSIFVIAIFGFSLVIPQAQKYIEVMFSRLQSKLSFNASGKDNFGGGLLIGVSLGLLWTPCVGPILASVISLAITGSVNGSAAIITLAYAAGTAIPMFMIIKGGQTLLQKNQWLLKNTKQIQKFFGVVMILTAMAIYFNIDRQFQTYVLKKFPQYGTGLTFLEDNKFTQDSLDKFNIDTSGIQVGRPTNESMQKAPEIIQGGEIFNFDSDTISVSEFTDQNKVVLIDFWTYTCINCIRTFPFLRDWDAKYSDQGLQIIGVHSPEFEFEKSAKNVGQAIEDFDIKYPVVQDNDFKTWRAYKNRFWPAKYLIDTKGVIRYTHFGEGDYDETEQKIQELLEEAGTSVTDEISNPTYRVETRTPEIYLGYARMEGFASGRVNRDKLANYVYPKNLSSNTFAYSGSWKITPEYSESAVGSKLEVNFSAKNVFLVMRSDQTTNVDVYLDGEFVRTIEVNKDMLYSLVGLDKPGTHSLELKFQDLNTQIFAFTFG